MLRPNSTTVLLADDHVLFLECLTEYFRNTRAVEIVGTATDFTAAIALAAKCTPRICLLDVKMPGPPVHAAIARIKAISPDTCVVLMSGFAPDRYIDIALRNEVAGFISKEEPPKAVAAAIRRIAKGNAYFSPQIQARIVIDQAGPRVDARPMTRLAGLSARETEILRHLAQGLTYQQVADQTKLSVKTIEAHVVRLSRKLAVHGRVALTRYALREGLL